MSASWSAPPITNSTVAVIAQRTSAIDTTSQTLERDGRPVTVSRTLSGVRRANVEVTAVSVWSDEMDDPTVHV